MERTIDSIKKIRTVSEDVKSSVKAYNRLKKQILLALKEKPKSIPEIANEINIEPDIVTFYLMSLRKFGEIEVDILDDMDEYFYYKLKKQ